MHILGFHTKCIIPYPLSNHKNDLFSHIWTPEALNKIKSNIHFNNIACILLNRPTDLLEM